MYRILHDNGQQYGPVSADTVRQWIRDGRVHAQTRVQAEGSAEWQPLGEIAEFQADLRGPGAPTARAQAREPLPGAKSSAMAITSLVLGILGFVTVGVTAIVGLVLGIIATVRISRSQGQLRGRGVAIGGMVTSGVALLVVPIVALMAAIALPAFTNARSKAQTIACVNNLKQIGLATRMYSLDHSDHYPGDKWCDLTVSYLGSPKVLVCPGNEGSTCGYAYNSNLVGRAEGDVAPDTVMFFESDAGWNAEGGPELMISQPRHGNVFNVGFADGSVQQLSASRVKSLRWEP